LIRLWLIESVAVVSLAAVAGLFLAAWLIDVAVAFKPPVEIGQAENPTLSIAFSLDYRVFAFTFGLSLLTAGVFGLIAGLHNSNPGPRLDLTADRASDRRFAPGFNLRSIVIAAQMALCLLLLIPCGLLVRSWQKAATISPGFSVENVLLLPIARDQAGVRVQKPPGFERDLVERLRSVAGVESVTAMDPVPLWFGGNATVITADGADGGGQMRTAFARIAPGYFATLRIPLLRGRDFTLADDSAAPRVVIVNETMARRLWPGGDAIGRRFREPDGVVEVVGIARDAKYSSLAERSEPFVYFPLAQDPTNNLTLSLAVRGTGDSRRLADAIEREVRALVPEWPAFHYRMLDEGLEIQRLLPRFAATLLGVLGAFALLLAMIGVYGVMAYVARQRTHEIGIRLALGAPRANVLSLLIRQGMIVCLAGAAAGIAIALIATNLLSSLLVGVGGSDPLTYTAVPVALLGVAVLACYLPARHAARVNPIEVLRRD
jgi:predicted permease